MVCDWTRIKSLSTIAMCIGMDSTDFSDSFLMQWFEVGVSTIWVLDSPSESSSFGCCAQLRTSSLSRYISISTPSTCLSFHSTSNTLKSPRELHHTSLLLTSQTRQAFYHRQYPHPRRRYHSRPAGVGYRRRITITGRGSGTTLLPGALTLRSPVARV